MEQASWEDKIDLVKKKVGKNLTDVEFELLLYIAKKYGLDPLLGELIGQKFKNRSGGFYPATFITTRDGYLTIAHNSGQYDGMETIYDEKRKVARCEVWKKGCSHSTIAEVDMDEYNSGKQQWESRPKTMIKKCAESAALRRAFSIHSIYIREEMMLGSGDDFKPEEITPGQQAEQKQLPPGEKPVPDTAYKPKEKPEEEGERKELSREQYKADQEKELDARKKALKMLLESYEIKRIESQGSEYELPNLNDLLKKIKPGETLYSNLDKKQIEQANQVITNELNIFEDFYAKKEEKTEPEPPAKGGEDGAFLYPEDDDPNINAL